MRIQNSKRTLAILIASGLVMSVNPVSADIVHSGDVMPIPPEGITDWIGGFGALRVGFNGIGSFGISGGSHVSANPGFSIGDRVGSLGDITVQGNGSMLISGSTATIGRYGEGHLNVLDGATTQQLFFEVATHPGSIGTVRVSGPGSTIVTGIRTDLAEHGVGSLHVENGGTMTTPFLNFSVFEGAQGYVAVSGAGSSLSIVSDFHLAYAGSGALEVTDGGGVEMLGSCTVGSAPTGIGYLFVSGPDSWMSCSQLEVGKLGSGVFIIEDGAHFEGDVKVHANPGNVSSAEFRGAETTLAVDSIQVTSSTGPDAAGQSFVTFEDGFQNDIPNLSISADIHSTSLVQAGGRARFSMHNVEFSGEGVSRLRFFDRAWVTMNNLILGESATNDSVLVEGGSTRLTVLKDFVVGSGSHANSTVEIRNSARVICEGLDEDGEEIMTYIGGRWGDESTHGLMIVEGNGSRFVQLAGSLILGAGGSGQLDILTRGEVSIDGYVSVGEGNNSQGVLRVRGFNAELFADAIGMQGQGDNIIEVGDGGRIVASRLFRTGRNSEVVFDVRPGFEPFVYSNQIALSGTLTVNFGEEAPLVEGESRVLMTAFGSQSGRFENVPEGGVLHTYDDLQMRLTYKGGSGNDVAIYVTKKCFCDWNENDVLNDDDFFAFIGSYFSGQGADFDENGTTNDDDFFGFLGCFFNAPSACGS